MIVRYSFVALTADRMPSSETRMDEPSSSPRPTESSLAAGPDVPEGGTTR